MEFRPEPSECRSCWATFSHIFVNKGPRLFEAAEKVGTIRTNVGTKIQFHRPKLGCLFASVWRCQTYETNHRRDLWTAGNFYCFSVWQIHYPVFGIAFPLNAVLTEREIAKVFADALSRQLRKSDIRLHRICKN